MPELDVIVKGRIAQGVKGQYAVCENSDYVVKFDFDDEWNTERYKTARFIWNDKYEDVVFEGNECRMPIISDAHKIKVGVFAGDLQTTTPAIIIMKKSILCGGATAAKPSEDVYSQIMALLNDLKELSDEELAAAIAKYLAENPMGGGIETLSGTEENPVNVLDPALYTGKNKVYFVTGAMNNAPDIVDDIGFVFGFLKIFAVTVEDETAHIVLLDLSPMQVLFDDGDMLEVPLYYTVYEEWEGNFEEFEWECRDINQIMSVLVTLREDEDYNLLHRGRKLARESDIPTFDNDSVLRNLREDSNSDLLHRDKKLMKASDVESLVDEKLSKKRITYNGAQSISIDDGFDYFFSGAAGSYVITMRGDWTDFGEAWIKVETVNACSITFYNGKDLIYTGEAEQTMTLEANQVWVFEIKGNIVKATQVA